MTESVRLKAGPSDANNCLNRHASGVSCLSAWLHHGEHLSHTEHAVKQHTYIRLKSRQCRMTKNGPVLPFQTTVSNFGFSWRHKPASPWFSVDFSRASLCLRPLLACSHANKHMLKVLMLLRVVVAWNCVENGRMPALLWPLCLPARSALPGVMHTICAHVMIEMCGFNCT